MLSINTGRRGGWLGWQGGGALSRKFIELIRLAVFTELME